MHPFLKLKKNQFSWETNISFRPDNLKVLFRPILMIKPDIEQITEVSLFSNGFHDAKVLSKKIATLFKTCSELLSAQDQYDFGILLILFKLF